MERYVTPEVVMAGRFVDAAAPRWKAAVLLFRDQKGSGTLMRGLEAAPYGSRVLWGTRPALTHEARIGEHRVGVIAECLWGGPQAAILVEELAHLGVELIVGIGAAGSLVASLPKGSIIVADSALAVDGTSRAYTGELHVDAAPELLQAVSQAAGECTLCVHAATVANVDAVYRETPAQIEELRGQGADVVNMETSVLYAASLVCGVRSVWLGEISDTLVGERWDAWTGPALVTEHCARLGRRVLSALLDGR